MNHLNTNKAANLCGVGKLGNIIDLLDFRSKGILSQFVSDFAPNIQYLQMSSCTVTG